MTYQDLARRVGAALRGRYPHFGWRVVGDTDGDPPPDDLASMCVIAEVTVGNRAMHIEIVKPTSTFAEYLEVALEDTALQVAQAIGAKLAADILSTREEEEGE